MKTYLKKMSAIPVAICVMVLSTSSIAEEKPQHKHYKATMPEKSHQEYIEKRSEKQVVEKGPTKKKHKHYKAIMPGETHKQYIAGAKQGKSKDTNEEKQHQAPKKKGSEHKFHQMKKIHKGHQH